MSDVARLLEENERLRAALVHFGNYPDAWDALSDRTRLELRIEQPASRRAAAHVTWRISDLKKAKAALIRKNADDRAYPAEIPRPQSEAKPSASAPATDEHYTSSNLPLPLRKSEGEP